LGRYIILLAIRCYWLIPERKRRKCIFRKSCSTFVYEESKGKGTRAGWKALRQRFRQCNGKYNTFHTPDGKGWVLLADHSVVELDELREYLVLELSVEAEQSN